MAISPRLKRYDQVLLDLDGTVWLGDEPIEGAPEAVAALREAGKAVAFLTNDVRHAPEEFVRRLWGFGFQAALSEVVSVGAAVQFALSKRGGGAAYVVGSQALVDHVAEAGMRIVNGTEFATRADVVVVGGHDDLTSRSCGSPPRRSLRGAELVGADARRHVPDARRAVAGHRRDPGGDRDRRRPQGRPRSIGKPEPPMYEAARDRLGEGACLGVGDRLDVDVAGARRAGLDSALVLTGSTSRAEANAADPKPTYVADSLAELVLGSRGARHGPRLCLIVNPHAGAGRAARLLPDVEAALRARGLRFRVERTTSMEHARELARGAAAAGEVAVAMGGDGLTGAVAGELRDGAGVLGVLPGGRGNDFARKLGIPHDPVPACDATSPRAPRARIDLAEVGGRAYLGIAQRGLRLRRPTRSPTRTRLKLGTGVYVYAHAARAARAGAPPRWTVTVDGESRDVRRATPSPWPTRACSAAACTWCRTRSSTTGCSTSC